MQIGAANAFEQAGPAPAFRAMKLAALNANRVTAALLIILIALNLAPLFWILVPPTQDGPAHLSLASTWKHLLAHDSPALERYFEINRFPEPNLLGHVALMLLLKIMTPFVAEKVLFGIFVATLPLAACYAIRSVKPGGPLWPALLIVPFGWSKMMQAGFYNFCLSLPVFYLCLGFFLRVFDRLTAFRVAVLGLLTLLLYFSHAMSIGMFFVSVALLVPWWIWVECGNDWTKWKAQGSRVASLLAALAPAGVLYAAFLVRNRVATHAYGISLIERIGKLAVLSSLIRHRWAEAICSIGILLLFASLTAAWIAGRPHPWKARRADGLLALAALFLLILLVIPDFASGGSAHSQRAELYPFLVLPLWFAAQPHLRGGVRVAVVGLAGALAVGSWGLNNVQLVKIDQAVREYYSVAAHLQPGRTVLPLVIEPYGRDTNGKPLSMRSEIFLFAANRFNPLVGAIELNNYQAAMPGFAVRYKRGGAHWSLLGADETWSRMGEELRSGHLSGNPDYVLLYGWDEKRIRARPEYRAFSPEEMLRLLERVYKLEYVSRPSGAVRLYRLAGRRLGG
jgi:hypothetical protein